MKLTINDFLQTEVYTSKKIHISAIDLFLFLIITVLAVLARIYLFPLLSNDYTAFLEPWFYTIKESGGFSALSENIGNYTPLYMYILSFLTYLRIEPLVSIKLVSCIFDFLLAITITKMVFTKYNRVPMALFAYGISLFLPTILLNSAAWAQCDVIFTYFLVLCFNSLLKGNPISAMVFFSISFCFKLQAIFLVPFLILMWLEEKVNFKQLLLVPAIYIISVLPAFILGRPFTELLLIYFGQADQYSSLSMNAPNLYSFIGQLRNDGVATAALLGGGIIVLFAIYYIYNKRPNFSAELMIKLAFASALLLPSVLPHMHERYFFVADVFAILYFFYNSKRWYISALVVFSSLCCYLPYLFQSTPLQVSTVSLFMVAGLIFLCYDIHGDLKAAQGKKVNTKFVET